MNVPLLQCMSQLVTSRQFAATQHFGRFRGEADQGRRQIRADSVENDPSATLAMHCGNDFDAGFDPYQSARLSR
jgi:hypothetical protein